MFGAPPDKEQSMMDYAADLDERLRDTHSFNRHDLKVESDRMKADYDQLANTAGFQEGDGYGYIAQSGDEGSPTSYRHLGNVTIRSSTASTTLGTRFSGISGR
jgi:hypothetical protein